MPGKRPKVLVADDSATVLMMEKMLLANEGLDLVTASNGAEAYQKARAEKPDVVILDVVMPQMTGFEVCEKLRQTEELREVPIILVTTRGEPANMEKGYASGCSDYITKPISNSEFLAKVRQFLPR